MKIDTDGKVAALVIVGLLVGFIGAVLFWHGAEVEEDKGIQIVDKATEPSPLWITSRDMSCGKEEYLVYHAGNVAPCEGCGALVLKPWVRCGRCIKPRKDRR